MHARPFAASWRRTTAHRRASAALSRFVGVWVLLLFAIPSASADVTVKLSKGVTAKLGAHPAEGVSNLQAQLNGVLRDIASGKATWPGMLPTDAAPYKAAAAAVLKSKQTIRIMCQDEAEALLETDETLKDDPGLKAALEQSERTFFPTPRGGAAIRGDFDKAGNPKPKGTAIIVIDCALLKHNGWWQESRPTPPPSKRKPNPVPETVFGILGHEMLHVSSDKYVHTPADKGIYDRFQGLFVAWSAANHYPGPAIGPVVLPPEFAKGKGGRYVSSHTRGTTETRTTIGPDGRARVEKIRGGRVVATPEVYWVIPQAGVGRVEVRQRRTRTVDRVGGQTDKSVTTYTTYSTSGQELFHVTITDTPSSRTRTVTVPSPSGPVTSPVETWDPETLAWPSSAPTPKTVPKAPSKPKPSGGTSSVLPSPLGGGAFAMLSPGLIYVPLVDNPRVGYQWSATGGWMLRPGPSPLALGLGVTLQHGVAPRLTFADTTVRQHEVRVVGQARPGAVLAGGRLLVSGVIGLGYAVERSTVTGASTSANAAHGVAVGLGAEALFAVWRGLAVGASVGVNLQWLRAGGQTIDAHAFNPSVTAGWFF